MILFSDCLWCREVIAQAEPGGLWMSGDDEAEACCPGLSGLEHMPSLVRHEGCDVLHAGPADARTCIQAETREGPDPA